MLLGNFAQWDGFAHTGARVQDVDLALFPLDCIEQTVEVVEIGRVPAHAGHVRANQPDGLVDRLLPPARDENVGAFFNEPLGARQRQAARTTRDECNLTFKLSHNDSLRKMCRIHFSRVDSFGADENCSGVLIFCLFVQEEGG